MRKIDGKMKKNHKKGIENNNRHAILYIKMLKDNQRAGGSRTIRSER